LTLAKNGYEYEMESNASAAAMAARPERHISFYSYKISIFRSLLKQWTNVLRKNK